MDRRVETPSPYRVFSRDEWASLRSDTPMTLSAAEVEKLLTTTRGAGASCPAYLGLDMVATLTRR